MKTITLQTAEAAALLVENVRLSEQIDQLQAASNKQLECIRDGKGENEQLRMSCKMLRDCLDKAQAECNGLEVKKNKLLPDLAYTKERLQRELTQNNVLFRENRKLHRKIRFLEGTPRRKS